MDREGGVDRDNKPETKLIQAGKDTDAERGWAKIPGPGIKTGGQMLCQMVKLRSDKSKWGLARQ